MENEIKCEKTVNELWNEYFEASKAEHEARAEWLRVDLDALLGKDFVRATIAYDAWISARMKVLKAERVYHHRLLGEHDESEEK